MPSRVGGQQKQAVDSVLFGYTGAGAREKVWMSHGDEVVKLPAGFSVVATSDQARPRPSQKTPGRIVN